MDHVFASKWLVNELSRLGFSLTYHELTRFKQSAVQMDESGSTAEAYPESFTQWVGDNVDHNTVTLDGQGTFHGMGVISISTPTDMHTFGEQKRAVPRRARVPISELVRKQGIPIVPYCMLRFVACQRCPLKLLYSLIRHMFCRYH